MAQLRPSQWGPAFDAEYAALPAAIQHLYTPKEYAWLPPERRARLIEDETMPEAFED
jgi:hypothetical protein